MVRESVYSHGANLKRTISNIATGNPVGGLVFSSAFGQLEQIQEWTVSPPRYHGK